MSDDFFRRESRRQGMNNIRDAEAAIEIAEAYADAECIGEFGDLIDTKETDAEWIVEFRTHTFSDAHEHRVRITKSVGNVIAHDRTGQFC